MKWLIGKFLSLVKNFKTGLGSWNFLSPPFNFLFHIIIYKIDDV